MVVGPYDRLFPPVFLEHFIGMNMFLIRPRICVGLSATPWIREIQDHRNFTYTKWPQEGSSRILKMHLNFNVASVTLGDAMCVTSAVKMYEAGCASCRIGPGPAVRPRVTDWRLCYLLNLAWNFLATLPGCGNLREFIVSASLELGGTGGSTYHNSKCVVINGTFLDRRDLLITMVSSFVLLYYIL